VHKIQLLPLSLLRLVFGGFTSLAPNSIDNWPTLKQKFHEYFYNGEAELRLSNLTTVRQKHNDIVPEYLWRLRETKNTCYNLTIGEKDLADLAFLGFSSYLRQQLEGHEFFDVNQVLQRTMVYKNRAKDQKAYSRFRDNGHKDREKGGVNYLEDNPASDEEGEVCVAEWVDMPRDKPISCSLLRQGAGRKDEVKYTFDVSKCDRLFDVLVKGGD
jgi:hypothetical protein